MLNSVSLVGRVGDAPAIKYFDSGKCKATLSIATDRGFGQDKKTDWHKVELWGKQAESAVEHVKKGDVIGVTGALEYNTFEKDGNKQKVAIVAAQRWAFCGGGKKDDGDRPATDSYDDF